MGRGKNSATASNSSQQQPSMVHATSGDYPQSMESLVDQNGHISLNSDDYDQYSRDEVEAFLAAQSYETNAVFNPDGKLLYLVSQWRENKVKPSYMHMRDNIMLDGSTTGDGYIDMHNHPNNPGGLMIFSGNDIEAYVYSVLMRDAFGSSLPNKFVVRTHDGYKFELEYVGGGDRDYNNFTKAYNRRKTQARKDAYAGGGSFLDNMSSSLDEWLRKMAWHYGFKYTSNWDK